MYYNICGPSTWSSTSVMYVITCLQSTSTIYTGGMGRFLHEEQIDANLTTNFRNTQKPMLEHFNIHGYYITVLREATLKQ